MGDRRDAYRVLEGRPEARRLFGRARLMWEDYIKMDIKKWDGEVRTGLIWLRIGTGGGHLERR